ncbi:MAG: ABC transporter substrate-binding protein [Faecalibacterium sp.]
MSNAISRRDFLKVTGAVGAAGLLAACGGGSAASSTTANDAPVSVAGPSSDPVTLTISWWGGDSRHEAYQAAIKEFMAEHSTITVNPTFAAWSGWEDTMSTKFAGGVAEDVCQVNWNWLFNYSGKGQTFLDLNSVSDYLDLTQWDATQLNACVVANAQQAVPVSMTGRIFYWNMATFQKAGIDYPKTEAELLAAGKTFKEKLGDNYYPLHLGAYDRMILMVFYLESKYGKDWADPATSTLNYTAEEIAEGIDFIKKLVDEHVIMSLPTYYGSNGDSAANQSNEWISGQLAGVFEWDSGAVKYKEALPAETKDSFVVGDEIEFGSYKGGFTKVSMGLAITKTCKNPAEGAMLINFLLNEEKGAKLMGSACGVPASKAGLAAAQAAGAVDGLVAEANSKVMASTAFQLDPLFEATDLKATGTGTYQEVFDTLDYDKCNGADLVDILLDGMEAVGYNV